MTKLGNIDFDDRILDALRDDRLVVFAGAGVSMGPPSSLDSFWELARGIAQGTGHNPSAPLDRFLGNLHHCDVAVHERAAQLLSPANSAPNALHYDLLRLFRTADRVKLVTTNFDLHFETAANTVFESAPDVYRAPALPLGYDFSGIIHVHGALPRTRDLVLTDTDFGRAYLTEGWARRFLVDVFRRYTVLFVGYSHDDVVMNYLARALPADRVADRLALTEKDGDWDLLGITPIRFSKRPGHAPFKELYDGVRLLAERTMRGALDWQSRLAEIGSNAPPTDEEAISEVEQALREVHTTRFLLNVARDPEWLHWLNRRKHLDALFRNAELCERDLLFSGWLAQHFAIQHSSDIFEIVAAHELRLNPAFWFSIGRELGVNSKELLEESTLKRWTTILLANIPPRVNHHVLNWLAERCVNQGCIKLGLTVFMAMTDYRLSVKQGFAWPSEAKNERPRLDANCPLRSDHWSLNEVWTKNLKPHLTLIAQPLLASVTLRLEEIYSELKAWDKASHDWDPVSYGRSAIEPHEQDQYPEAVDVLIDAARDALEWLAENSPPLLSAWIEQLMNSDAPLLRRLAVHAVTIDSQRSHEDRLEWLLNRLGLHRLPEHHEVHRAVALSYTIATESSRKSVVEAVMGHALPASDTWPAEERTARSQFDWLCWLLQAKPDCPIAREALTPIKAQFPDWLPSDHPDLTHWTGSANWMSSESPWSVEQLLNHQPHEQLDDLQAFKSNRFGGPSREGLLSNIREACKQSTSWAFALTKALADQEFWSSDIWPAIFRGFQESEIAIEKWRDVISLISNSSLQLAHAGEIADLLFSLVRDGGKPFAVDVLEEANAIALPLWQALTPKADSEDIKDWLSCAINCPAGVIVEFWVNGLSILLNGKTGPMRVMPDDYRHWFTAVVLDSSSKGGMGRAVLASQTAFLFGLDQAWTEQHLIPLFSDQSSQKFAQAWDGFLVWGRLNPAIADALLPAFVAAIPRLNTELNERRKRFIEFYTALAVFHESNPTQQLLPTLFQQGSFDDRLVFASHLGFLLRKMQQSAKQNLWESWLHRYWQGRLQGVLAPLEEAEVSVMLDWLPYLGDSYPDAVALAVRSPTIHLEHSRALYELRKSDLVIQFPTETANLLIYFAGCRFTYHATEMEEVEKRLPPLPQKIRTKLSEAFAQAGILPSVT